MRTCAHRPFRPALEALEAREVPATFNWTGAVSTDALNPANWSSLEEPGGLPGEDDHLYFGGLSVIVVPLGGPPSPPTPGGSSVNCDNLQSLGNGFAGVHISAAYTGTVTMGEALTVGVFNLANGAISQSAAAHDLTVTGTFNWTGGVLNSSAALANFTLSGATATIAPGTTQLTTGSDLNFVSGASGVISFGQVNFNNGAVPFIDALSTLVSDTTFGNVVFASAAPPLKTLKVDGNWTIDGGKTNSVPIPVHVTGTLKLIKSSTLDIDTDTLQSHSLETKANKGVISIENNSTLKVSDSVVIAAGGALQTTVNPTALNQTDQRSTPAKIVGVFKLTGGSVTLNVGSNPHVWGLLKVDGRGEWTGGTINITINNNATLNRFDQIYFTGELVTQVTVQGGQPVAGSPKFVITSVIPPNNNQVFKDLIKADDGISTIGPIPLAGTGFTITPQAPVQNKVLAWDIQT